MVLTRKELAHLDLMADLENSEPLKVNAAELLSPNSGSKESSLVEDILTLCAKLRASGFEKQASGLEIKFAEYQKLYSKDMKSFMDKAHPEGDVEIVKGKEDLGLIETIYSQQDKNLEIARKSPEKKASADLKKKSLFKIVDSCKKIIASPQELSNEEIEDKINLKIEILLDNLNYINEKSKNELTISIEPEIYNIKDLLKNKTLDNFEKILKWCDFLSEKLQPSSGFFDRIFNGNAGLSKDTYEIIKPRLNSNKKIIQECINLRKKILINIRKQEELNLEGKNSEKETDNTPPKNKLDVVEIKSNPNIVFLNKSLLLLKQYRNIIQSNSTQDLSEEKRKEGIIWIDEESKEISEMISKIEKALNNPKISQIELDSLNKEISTISKDIATFYNDWIE